MIVTLQADLDLQHIERSYYTLLDVLSDVGGLDSALIFLGQIIISFFYGDGLREHLASKLYLFDDGEKGNSK